MKLIRQIFAILLIITMVAVTFPTTAIAATAFEITSISLSPNAVSLGGGSVNVSITIKNTGTDPITNISYIYNLPSGNIGQGHADTIAVGASKTYTDSIQFQSNDVNKDIQAEVWCLGGGWANLNKTFKVIGEENVIRSGSEIAPEKSVYYVGETVDITDTMRNSLNDDVTNLKMKYYYRRSGNDTDGETITFALITPNEKVENTINYTFTEDDINGLRIGSSVTYYVAGNGPYTEYNVAHDFDVEPAPTPTASPTPTDTPDTTPTQEQTPTPSPTTQATEAIKTIDTFTPVPKETVNSSQESNNSSSFVISERSLLLTVIILAGVIVILVLIAIIVSIVRKK